MPVLTAEEQQSQFLLEVPDWTRISQLLRDCLIKLHSYHHPPLEDVFSPLNKAHILALQASSGLVTPQSSGESCVVTKSHTLSDNQLSSKPQISKQTGECVDTQIFEGIIQFLTNEYSDANRGEFLTDLLPALLNRALEFEELRKKYLSRRGCVGKYPLHVIPGVSVGHIPGYMCIHARLALVCTTLICISRRIV